MLNKVISVREAAELVRPGDTLALGGMTLYRRPVTFVRALLAQSPRLTDLILLSFAAGYESDLLLGGGVASAIRTCYCGLEAFGLAPMFTERAGKGQLRIIEESEASLAHGLRANLAGVSFMPGLGWLGTDMLKLRPDVKVIDDPYNPGEIIVAFPAIPWDVAVIHALKADASGNALLNDNVAVDGELALGARDVIITAEQIVDNFEGQQVTISGATVRAVVHAPGGAWPTSCYPEYPIAGGEILRYIEACNAGGFEEYVRTLEVRASTAEFGSPG